MRIRLLVLFLLCGLAVACAPRHRLSAVTGPPRIVRASSIALPLLTWQEYREIAAIRAAHPSFVTMTNDRSEFDEATRFTILPLVERSVALALVTDAASRRVFRIDLDGDGDVLNDAAYRSEARGAAPLELSTTRTIVRDAETLEGVLHFRLLEHEGRPGEAPGILFEHSTLRRGRVRVGTREIEFGLLGEFGEYDQAHNMLLIDRDGDGDFGLDDPDSTERVALSEGYVNLGGRSFTFHVDPRGERLNLERLHRKLPDRAIIREGRPAPDFAFDDLDGRTQRLSDYRGKVVLLAFWATWCRPCVREAPELKQLLQTYGGRGFAILGIHAGGDEPTVREFLDEHDVDWPQAIQESDGEIMRLYRVPGYPTNVLIDRDGTIVAPNVHPHKLRTYLDSLLRSSAG